MGRMSVTLLPASGTASTGSIRDTSRSVSAQWRLRLVAITLFIIFMVSTLFIQLPAVSWRQQLATNSVHDTPRVHSRDFSGVHNRDYSGVRVSSAPASGFTEASALSTPGGSASSGNHSSSACPPSPLLTVNGGGRLGNKLCQYFTLWAEHHTNFTSTSVWIASKMARNFSLEFAGQRSITALPSRCRPKRLHPVRMDAIASGLRAGRDVCIGGGVCNVAGFARHRDKMLSEFPWKEDLTQVATARLAAAGNRHGCRPTNCTFIGVHMRRGDYSEWIRDRMNGQPVGTEYFQCALSLCRGRYPGAVFIVASDDVDWARANILGEDVAIASDLEPAGKLASRAAALDMATLSLCNHTIVSYGTFSYMAAFMAGGDIVAPTGYSSNEHFVADGMIRSGWNVTLLHYRTCREIPLEDRTPFTGLSLVIDCDM